MTRTLRAVGLLGALLLLPSTARAQDPAVPPLQQEPIGRFVVDARGVFARFKENVEIAGTLGVDKTNLPTRGYGVVVGAHVYPLRTRRLALGLGGEMLLRARGSRTKPAESDDEDAPDGPTVATRMTAVSPQVSLNFGKRDGYSYVSAGMGRATFTSELQDAPIADGDIRPSQINYGGGARWFLNGHVAFSLDLRFYRIKAQEAAAERPAYPGTTIMVLSGGIAIR